MPYDAMFEMETSLDLLLWRSFLPRAPAVPGIHDQIEWADLCFSQGLRAPARLLYETAFLRQGFSAELLARQAGVADRTGLWDATFPVAEDRPPSIRGTIEIAIAELQTLSRAVSPRLAHDLATREETAPDQPRSASAEALLGDMADIVHRLFRFLQRRDQPHDEAAINALLALVREVTRRGGSFDYRMFGTAPLPLLASAIGFASLREFILLNHDFIFGAFGSADFLHQIAGFDHAGLGPYLTNVPRLARKSRDIFELAQIAKRAGEGEADVEAEIWVVLLSQHLTGALREEVVDDLGDLGAMAALSAIYDRAVRWPDARIEVNLVMRLRDAALDNGDFDLAARAQALIVRLHPELPLERWILGSIEASGGLIAAAEQTFLDCLNQAPDDEDVTERLLALRAGRFEPFTLRHGFGTPEIRLRTRLQRRQGRSARVRAENKRPIAVEL